MPSVAITQLFIYPVKSLAGIAVDSWPAAPTGLLHDRQFMLVDESGRFVTQRQHPEMVLIKTALSKQDSITLLQLSHAEFGTQEIALRKQKPKNIFIANIWGDSVSVFEPDTGISTWLSQILNKTVRLVALAEQRPQTNPERFGEDTHTIFADAAPYLIANQASLDELNRVLADQDKSPVDIRRFRPNIVINGDLPAFAEHDYQHLESQEKYKEGSYKINLIDHCERCVMTTIDPDTGIRDEQLEPFKTLATINPTPNSTERAKPAFAVNAALISGETELRVGDRINIES